jgi:hypothetical protein
MDGRMDGWIDAYMKFASGLVFAHQLNLHCIALRHHSIWSFIVFRVGKEGSKDMV